MTITQTLTALANAAEGETLLWLDTAFYAEDCLSEAVDAFTGHCAADVADRRSSAFALRIRISGVERQEAAATVGSFLNYLICLTARRTRGAEPVA